MADQIKEKMFAAYPFVPLQDIVVKTVQKTEGKGKNKVVVEEKKERKLQFVKQLLFGHLLILLWQSWQCVVRVCRLLQSQCQDMS